MDIRKIIEEIDSLTEDEFVDDFEDTEVSNDSLQDINEPEVSTTEQLDAKTKISRALDVLKDAIEDFKSATVEELDLVKDADLTATFESLDDIVDSITAVLNGDVVPTERVDFENTEELEPAPEAEDEENEEETEDIDFDSEAELDLLGTEETEEDKD